MLKQVRRALLAAFVFSGAINLLMLATPLYTLQVFESVVPLDSIETLVVLTVMTGAAILASALIEIARDMLLLRAGLWLDHELGQHILENGLKLGASTPELKQDIAALEQFKAFLSSGGVTPLFDAPWVPIFLIALVCLNPVLGAVGAISALLLLMVAIAKGLLTNRLQQEASKANERSRTWWTMVAASGQLAGALGLSKGASQQWETYNRAHIASSYSLGKRASFVKALTRAIRIGSQIALYGVGAWLIVRAEMTPGVLVASAILLARALAPLEQLVGTMKAVQTSLGAYRRLKALPTDAVVPRVSHDEIGPSGRIQISDAAFYYPTRKMPALRGVSLSLAPGECLGIAGPNGSGKSTLAAILAGALVPTSGAADLDGIPIAKWQRCDGYPPIGYLPDDPVLVEGSVHDNIARFSDASLVSSAQAAMRAGVHETLHNLAQGYDTAVGVNGSGLAFRERRAVALARALHGNPRAVVLDEPEIGLDGASMKGLIKVLEQLKADGVGFIVVTQDPRLIALTDRIVVLNNGAVQSAGQTTEMARRMNGGRSSAEAGLH